ncbi:MAG: hypothetical protein E6H91_03480 [Chloroflexi bacterium]|nr:MAG: hypothetical protein E6H91_03480 [Chloroflexota bacterium]
MGRIAGARQRRPTAPRFARSPTSAGSSRRSAGTRTRGPGGRAPRVLGDRSRRDHPTAAFRAGRFELVVTAEEAGAYKPDPLPYRMALDRLGLDSAEVLFVAGSAHDVGGAARVGMDVYWANRGGAPAPTDGAALREEPDFRGLLETLGWDPHSGAGGQSPPSSW